MPEVIVFAEGPTEEQFIKRVIAPELQPQKIYLKPQTLKTSQDASGGAVSFDRLKFYARNALRNNANAVLSTFLDLYGLDTSFPDFNFAKESSQLDTKLRLLESALHQAIIAHVGCRAERFIPHIQPHEFEGLLFSNTKVLSQTEPNWHKYEQHLEKVRDEFDTPEHINNSYETKPSRRLEVILNPSYKKTRHGPLAAKHIGLHQIETECPHFRGWTNKLRALGSHPL